MKKQSGFTLIELVMVIVILGILAATALPKFVDMGGDARKAVMQGVEGAMRSANTIIYAKAAQTAGALGAGPTNVTVGSATVSVVYGYAADVTELQKVMDLSGDFTVAAGYIRHSKATTPANCEIAYSAPASAGASPTYTATNNFSGC
jgi:MSHA pilin protein MshA